MTRYWIKIGLGALLVFALGMALWYGVRKGVGTVHTVFETSEPISIPIRFATFRVDGVPLGKVQQVKLLRSAPKQVSSVEVTVRLDSAAFADRLRSCTMRIDDIEHIDERTTFVCVTPENPGVAGAFESFGVLRVEGTDIVLPVLLPAAAVRDIRAPGRAIPDSVPPPAESAAPAVPAMPPTP